VERALSKDEDAKAERAQGCECVSRARKNQGPANKAKAYIYYWSAQHSCCSCRYDATQVHGQTTSELRQLRNFRTSQRGPGRPRTKALAHSYPPSVNGNGGSRQHSWPCRHQATNCFNADPRPVLPLGGVLPHPTARR
jgi:hypothetical protein